MKFRFEKYRYLLILTYDKNGPCRSWIFKIWSSTFFDLILWWSDLRQNWLWSFWFLNVDRVHYLYDHDLRQKWPLPFPILQNLTEYIFWLDSLMVWPTTKLAFGLSDFSKLIEYIIIMIFWPTTKMALAVPDSSKFDWVHFLLDSLMVRPTTKLGFGLSDFSIIDEVHFFG